MKSKTKPLTWQIVLFTVIGYPTVFLVFGFAAQWGRDWIYDHQPTQQTKYAISEIGGAALGYTMEHGKFPPSAENRKLVEFLLSQPHAQGVIGSELTEHLNPKHEIVDEWGTPLRILFQGEDDVVVQSAGPDKIFGTPDDITWP